MVNTFSQLTTVTLVGPDDDGFIRDGMCCDACEAPARTWPTGLISMDREHGAFTGDFVMCPACSVDKNFAPTDGLLGMLRRGVTFAYIAWFWFVADADRTDK